jgi:hypothetical protein
MTPASRHSAVAITPLSAILALLLSATLDRRLRLRCRRFSRYFTPFLPLIFSLADARRLLPRAYAAA